MEPHLPQSALVNKFIPKTRFYQKTSLSSKLKDEFINKVQKITWKYKLSEDSIGIAQSDNVTEIQNFEIELKDQTIPQNILKVIDKAIPYPILYQFSYKGNIAYGISLKGSILKNIPESENFVQNYYFSEWNEVLEFDFTGIDLEKVYQKLIRTFVRNEAGSEENFEDVLKTDNKIKGLEKEITLLSRKISKEKQFNKKVDLNKKLLERQKQLQTLTKGLAQ